VDEATVNRWKQGQPEFCESLKNGKQVADANVAQALYHRALGYSHHEEKLFQYEGGVIRADTIRHYPPDTGAAFIWLKNRAGWRDKIDHDLRTPDGPIEIAVTRKVMPAATNRIAGHLATNGNGTKP
jgi:hypothetical protein